MTSPVSTDMQTSQALEPADTMDRSQLLSDSNPGCVPGIYILNPVPRNMTKTPYPDLGGTPSQPHTLLLRHQSYSHTWISTARSPIAKHYEAYQPLWLRCSQPSLAFPRTPGSPPKSADYHSAQQYVPSSNTASGLGDSESEGRLRGDAEPVPRQMPTLNPHSTMTTPGLSTHVHACWQATEYSEQMPPYRSGEQDRQDPVLCMGPQSQTRDRPRVHAAPANQKAGVDNPTKSKRRVASMSTPPALEGREPHNNNPGRSTGDFRRRV